MFPAGAEDICSEGGDSPPELLPPAALLRTSRNGARRALDANPRQLPHGRRRRGSKAGDRSSWSCGLRRYCCGKGHLKNIIARVLTRAASPALPAEVGSLHGRLCHRLGSPDGAQSHGRLARAPSPSRATFTHASRTPARGHLLCPGTRCSKPLRVSAVPSAAGLRAGAACAASIRPIGTHGSPTIPGCGEHRADQPVQPKTRGLRGEHRPCDLVTPGLGRSGPAADARFYFKARFPPELLSLAIKSSSSQRFGGSNTVEGEEP